MSWNEYISINFCCATMGFNILVRDSGTSFGKSTINAPGVRQILKKFMQRKTPEPGELPELNFREAVSEIFWNWQLNSSHPHHHLERHSDEPCITVDKLYITPTTASYKMQNWTLAPGVWDKLNLWLDSFLPMLETIEMYEYGKKEEEPKE